MPKNEAASKSAKSRVVRESTRSDRYAILNSLVGHIVVLNPHGTILFYKQSLEPVREEERQSSTESGRAGNKLFGDLEAGGV